MKKQLLLGLCVGLCGWLTLVADAADPKPQTTCPIMEGQKINKKLYVDHQGKRIYVCCKGCLAEVKKNPEQVIQKMEAAGIVLEAVPAETKTNP